jgi:hypothetical protein
MARDKQRPAVRREPSDIHVMSNGVIHHDGYSEKAVEKVEKILSSGSAELAELATTAKGEPGVVTLVFCVGGIYASL